MITNHSQYGSLRPQRRRRTRGLIVVSLLLIGGLLCAFGARYGVYELHHDIPNPMWGIFIKSYSYTPTNAHLLNPNLLKIRPDLVELRYIHDYIQVAGTFPCIADLSMTYDPDYDPILEGHSSSCSIKRLVTNVTVTNTYVGIIGPDIGRPGAIVQYTIRYADGTHWSFQDILGSNQFQEYYLGYIHLTCWDSVGILGLYSIVLQHAPSGVRVIGQTSTSIIYHCQQ